MSRYVIFGQSLAGLISQNDELFPIAIYGNVNLQIFDTTASE